jgi:hypothetical protein
LPSQSSKFVVPNTLEQRRYHRRRVAQPLILIFLIHAGQRVPHPCVFARVGVKKVDADVVFRSTNIAEIPTNSKTRSYRRSRFPPFRTKRERACPERSRRDGAPLVPDLVRKIKRLGHPPPRNHEDQVKLTSRAAICILECHSRTNSEYLRISGANTELRSSEIIPGSV